MYHRLSEVGRLVMLPDVLGAYRRHANNTSVTRNAAMEANGRRFFLVRYREYLGEDRVSPDDIASIWKLCVLRRPATDFAELNRVGEILDALVTAFLERRRVEGSEREGVLAEASQVWWQVLIASSGVLGRKALDRYSTYENLGRLPVPMSRRLKALARTTFPLRMLRQRSSLRART